MSIQWYPGHIAKAEKALKEQLKLVDVILEVRDARIPLTTHHPRVIEWGGNKSRVLVINRLDMISPKVRQLWENWFKSQGETPFFTNAQQGQGIAEIAIAAKQAGILVNQKRRERGMLPRPVRAVVIGFPNVGKSALINRLLRRKVVNSARKAGVTKSLRWVRISPEIELLDAPGVIPSRLEDQEAALKLAICEDIGEAAYDNQLIAIGLIDLLIDLQTTQGGMVSTSIFTSRYQLDVGNLTGEIYIDELAKKRYQGDKERTARQILNDFRTGLLGTISLELPPL